ncbi:MAG: hypothetical protein ACT4QC_03670 [Planctomycetaceae bacterium]
MLEDGFDTEGKLSRGWTAMENVDAARDVKDGHLLLLNDSKKTKSATHVNVQNTRTKSGNIALEAKFDDFVPNDKCRSEVNISGTSVPGTAVVINRISLGDKQVLEFQVVARGKSMVQKAIPYPGKTMVLKVQVNAGTGEVRGFFKEKPDEQYKEMPGSPFASDAFKKDAYNSVVMTHHFGDGEPASVRVDWVRITGPDDNALSKAKSKTLDHSEKSALVLAATRQ